MPDPVQLTGSFRSFQAAEDYFRQKVNLPTQRWDDLRQGQHARAFVVAGATRDALLVDLRAAVDAAIAQGETLADFRRRFDQITTRHGWAGFTGDGTAAGRAWRTQVIYHTNLRTAYMAGRWETLKSFPFLKYQHNTVNNPRESHLAWDGKIIAADDPWWQTHYPPNGWGCRCSATGVSRARMRADGLQPDAAPPEVPGDPPPEWAYHVGQASSGRAVSAELLTAAAGGRMRALDTAGPAAFQRPERVPFDPTQTAVMPRTTQADTLRQAFRTLLGGDTAAVTDPTGAVIELGMGIVEHWLEDPARLQGREQYLPFLRETIASPFEVWVGFAVNELTGKVYLRRRYIKGIQIGKNRMLGLVADAIGGQWVSYTYFSGERPSANLRMGRLLWGR